MLLCIPAALSGTPVLHFCLMTQHCGALELGRVMVQEQEERTPLHATPLCIRSTFWYSCAALASAHDFVACLSLDECWCRIRRRGGGRCVRWPMTCSAASNKSWPSPLSSTSTPGSCKASHTTLPEDVMLKPLLHDCSQTALGLLLCMPLLQVLAVLDWITAGPCDYSHNLGARTTG